MFVCRTQLAELRVLTPLMPHGALHELHADESLHPSKRKLHARAPVGTAVSTVLKRPKRMCARITYQWNDSTTVAFAGADVALGCAG